MVWSVILSRLRNFIPPPILSPFFIQCRLSNYPIWEDASDTDIAASKESNPEEDYDFKKGLFKDLAKNITSVYGNMVKSNLMNEFQDGFQVPEPDLEERSEGSPFHKPNENVGEDSRILDGFNKVGGGGAWASFDSRITGCLSDEKCHQPWQRHHSDQEKRHGHAETCFSRGRF